MRPITLPGIAFPLRPEAFREALWRGQGRALLSVRALGDGPYRDALTEAFTRDIAYDQQCEGSRAAWLMEVIEPLTAEARAHYEATVLAALRACPADAEHVRDYRHLFSIATYFVRAGSTAALSTLRERFWDADKEMPRLSVGVTEEAIETAIALERFGAAGLDARRWQGCRSEFLAENRKALRALARELPLVAPLYEWVRTLKPYREPRRPRVPPPPATLAEVMAAVDDRATSGHTVPFRLRHMLPKEAQLALYERLRTERDSVAKARLLSVFGSELQPLPRLDEVVVAMLDDNDKWVRHRAMWSLQFIVDPRVREAALGMIRDLGGDRLAVGIRLLARNSTAADGALIEAALPADPVDRYVQHDLDLAILEFSENSEAYRMSYRLLRWMAERTYCTNCRLDVVELLHSWGGLPDCLRREMRHDASHEIRAIGRRRALR